ncbi:MAG: SCO family protein [Alphaproteobacteria bacterium]|jgi:protein SCO1/2|nr:SCO family protein [Alphaproteobacteria bacterium]MDP6565228.1 SCO family protein [Alphaproteobacteria bacterium]MDP6812810.1 SCO family protein [Alphaproteobacteria bacterium]
MKPRGGAWGWLAPLLLATSLTSPAQAADLVLDERQALAVSQAALGGQVGDHRFVDTDGAKLTLAELRGKPLVVNLIYTACVHTCPVIVQTLYEAVTDAQGALGAASFNVVTIGFDTPADTPDRMRSFARGQGVDLPNWRFLSGGGATIERLAKELGFVYFASPKGFDHLAQVSVLDGQGRLYRQVYGEDFDTPFLVEPLKDLVLGRNGNLTSIDGLLNRIRLFCTLYDPAAERYRFDYSIFIGIFIGLAALTTVGTILARNLWRWWRCQPGIQ